jgi:hypothetical protein
MIHSTELSTLNKKKNQINYIGHNFNMSAVNTNYMGIFYDICIISTSFIASSNKVA